MAERREPYIGQPLLRREDRPLLQGQGQFIADLPLPRMLHAAFVRSPHPHARILRVDLSRALCVGGVAAAYSGADLLRLLPPVPDSQLSIPAKWRSFVEHRFQNPRQPLLAHDKVRHVGEAVAVLLAESRYAAEDAAELVGIEYEPLPAAVDPEAALAEGAPLIHEDLLSNLIGEFKVGKGDAERALKEAPHRLFRRFYHHRYSAVPIECRGVAAHFDPRTGSLTIWSASQVVHALRREAALVLGLPQAKIRALALDVGGGFGLKGHVYPEELLIPFLARALARPVKWIEDRQEHFLSATHSRDQWHEVAVGFTDDGRLLALKDDFLVDCGAWNPVGAGIAYNTAAHLLGPYKVDHYAARGRIVATNKVPNAPYRGAGRPEAAFAMERIVDLVAREVACEPAELRRRNMITAEEMPYSVGIPYRDGEPIVYDGGDFRRTLEEALLAVGGLPAFRERQRAARDDGRHLGLGIGFYLEGTGVGPFEGATVGIDPSGKIHLSSGAGAQGQGMETIFAQILADLWVVQPEDVLVSLGDTAAIAMGFGTIASRVTVTLGAAVHCASAVLKEKVLAIAANLLECAPADLELRAGGVGIVGVPGRELPLARVAAAARPGWDHGRPPGIEPGLEETYYWEPPTVTWSHAAHVATVAVDAETGRVEIENYAIAHDCGVVVNPLLVEGQIRGGTVQGLGGILLEEIRYDANGQLLTGSLADYLLPTASDVPDIAIRHRHSPSPQNPLGVKGVGEGGAVAPPAAVANAVADALGIEVNETPIRAESIVDALRKRA